MNIFSVKVNGQKAQAVIAPSTNEARKIAWAAHENAEIRSLVVKPNSTWMHYSGNVYTVIEATETGFIKYKSASGHVLACSLQHFRENFIEVDNKEPE